jgi:hypothetical protein
MSSPRSIRFDPSTDAHLASFAARRAGLSHSGAAALLVEEGLRMDAHPGVLFREGPAGRRAVLVGGPDVWEVIRAVRSARMSEVEGSPDDVLSVVMDSTGLGRRLIDVAVAYYSEYPDDVDALIVEADAAEEAVEQAEQRRRSLLGA